MAHNLIRNGPAIHGGAFRLIGFRKLESFHPDGPIFRTPVIGAAPRVYQGLDHDKIVTFNYTPVWKTRDRYQSGYQYAGRNGQPATNSMSPEEMVTYFDTDNTYEKFTRKEVIKGFLTKYLRVYFYIMTIPAIITITFLAYFIPSNRYEAIEYYMPIEEYYENYVWHDMGKFIDKKAYDQYLEARRAKKWGRLPDINVVDYIPPAYRSEAQKQRQSDPEHLEELD